MKALGMYVFLKEQGGVSVESQRIIGGVVGAGRSLVQRRFNIGVLDEIIFQGLGNQGALFDDLDSGRKVTPNHRGQQGEMGARKDNGVHAGGSLAKGFNTFIHSHFRQGSVEPALFDEGNP